ncbi:hypothetical protein NC652_034410 [Populus alba x Populus x berolinensis]|nr:hypothetical protein NC652_034410 [Populus alba x Populus x berolinensis]
MRLSSKPLLKRAGEGISKTLSEILVCPISKQPLRYCKETNSLFSDSIAVSFPIKDGIPCLVPRDGKVKLEKISVFSHILRAFLSFRIVVFRLSLLAVQSQNYSVLINQF